jgi:hypothetical protein
LLFTSFVHEDFEICLNIVQLYSISEKNFTEKVSLIFKSDFKNRDRWEKHRCVYQLAHQLICRRKPINCTSISTTQTQLLPIIAIVAATTTRNTPNILIPNLPLFAILFPSLARTLECGYRYLFVLGYDDSDQYYSNPEV